ncbi:hypothetical protein [Albidovulum inexpectatum]|uniref:hypothetical protein n=1 Tax=Albidovulum inexpectatum TaxID=196587 RepID=UPI0011B0EFCE|nr:hypothetical protein [Albidovulum inexpectatum]
MPQSLPDTLIAPLAVAMQVVRPRAEPAAHAPPLQPFSDPATLIPMVAVLAVPPDRDMSPTGGVSVDQTPPISLGHGDMDAGNVPHVAQQADRQAALQPPVVPSLPERDDLPEVGASLPPGPALKDLRVLLNAPQDVSGDRIAEVVTNLAQSGFRPPDPTKVAFAISRSNVRYFHQGDAQAARILAERIGADLRDFTDFTPSPPQGTIEVWLAGRGAPQIRRAPGRTKRTTPRPDLVQQEAQRLRRSILQQLRDALNP